jgi:DNA modification methylase
MSVRIIHDDCREALKTLPNESIHCVVTSPPYWGLRDYGVAGQIGLEATPDAFVAEMVAVFREVRRVLRSDGTCWVNLGDSYNNRTKVRSTSHQPSLNGFMDDNWAERAAHGGVRMSYTTNGMKEKDLCGIPWRVAFALQADGWWLRQDIIWSKPNPMPESVTDRCTKAHEYIFLLTKSARYFYNAEAIKERAIATDLGSLDGGPQRLLDGTNANNGRNFRIGAKGNANGFRGGSYVGGTPGPRTEVGNGVNQTLSRNKRSVWEVATTPFPEAHFATFPPELIEPCIKAGCPKGGTVLDPFGGAGTTGLVADRLQRDAILIELNPEYAAMAKRRIYNDAPLFAQTEAAE